MSQIATVDCGFLTTVQAMAAEKWANAIERIDYIAHADAARAVLDNQRVNFEELKSKDKKRVVSIEWLTDCEATLTDCTDDCTITGDDASPVCKEYEITCLKESSFQVYDRVYRERTIDKQQSMAKQILNRKKLLDEWIAQYILTGILANAGTNVYTGAPGTVAAGTTTIPAGSWNDMIWGYLAQVGIMNEFSNPYAISGNQLFQLVYNRTADYANADGKGNVNRMGDLRNRLYFDLFNVEAIAPATMFLLHQNAVAFVNKAWYPLGAANADNPTADRLVWSEPSMNLPGIVYDIFTQRGCLNNDYYTGVKLQLHGVFAVNPTPCSDTNTGILSFECL